MVPSCQRPVLLSPMWLLFALSTWLINFWRKQNVGDHGRVFNGYQVLSSSSSSVTIITPSQTKAISKAESSVFVCFIGVSQTLASNVFLCFSQSFLTWITCLSLREISYLQLLLGKNCYNVSSFIAFGLKPEYENTMDSYGQYR